MNKVQAAKAGISFLWKKAPNGKLNPNNLGWVRPDGVINFASENAAETCAKNIVMNAFKAPIQYERGVVLSKNQILDVIEGDATSCPLNPMDYMCRIKFFHSHPDIYGKGKTTPISVGDFQALRGKVIIGNNIDEVVAFNSNGEYSKLTKICKEPQNWFQFFKCLIKYYKFDKVVQKKLYNKWSLADSQKQLNKANKQFIKATIFRNEDKKSELIQKAVILAEEQKKHKATKEDCKLIDWFWRKYAKKFGVKYETNYTSLKD